MDLQIRQGSELKDTEKHRDYSFVVGQPGYGKSYLTKNHLVKKYPCVIVLDRMGEYDGVEINDLKEMYDYIEQHRVFRIVVTDLTQEKVDEIFRIAWYFGKICVVVEEANIWFDAAGELTEIQNDILTRSRHRGISLIFVTQRFRRVHLTCRAMYQEMFIFRTVNRQDIKTLEDDTGENLECVQTYPVGKYFYCEN